MNLDNLKQKALAFLNTKVGVVLGVYFSMRLINAGVGSILGGGAGPVLFGLAVLVGGCMAFEHFYEKISV